MRALTILLSSSLGAYDLYFSSCSAVIGSVDSALSPLSLGDLYMTTFTSSSLMRGEGASSAADEQDAAIFDWGFSFVST